MRPRRLDLRGLFAVSCAVALSWVPGAARGASGASPALLGSARSAGLGAAAAVDGGIAGMQDNVAVLATQRGWAVSGTYLAWLEGTEVGVLTACAPTPAGTAALSVGGFTAGRVDIAEDGVPVRTVDAQRDVLVTAAFAREVVSGVEAGVAGNWCRSALAESWVSTAFSLDAGVRLVTADGKLALGGAVANAAGTRVRYAEESRALPRSVTAGAAWRPVRNRALVLLIAVDYVTAGGEADAQRAGVEAELMRTISLRAGVRRGGETTDFSAGLGARWNRVQFDYAVASPARLGAVSRATLTVSL